MKIFVTGGAGFIGSNFIRLILKRHPDAEVLNFDTLTYSGNLENLADVSGNSRYTFVKGDITNKRKLSAEFKKFQPDYLINFAAETHVDKSIHAGAEEFLNTNVWGVFHLLEMVKECGVKNFVQVSTDEVYGSLPIKGGKAFRENSELAPNSPYAATKASGDLLCRAYYTTWKVPVVVTRASNNYGPYQYPEKLIPFSLLRMQEERSLPLYGDGLHIRDWLYVLDHCDALEVCLFKGRPGEVYNIGAANPMSNFEIARLILHHFDRDESWIEYVSDRPGHDRRYGLDATKIKKELGWRPRTPFKTAFTETIRWYLRNKEWVASVKKKAGKLNSHIRFKKS